MKWTFNDTSTCISNCLQWLHFSETEFVGGYEDGSDTSEGSTSAGIGTLNALPATRVSFKPSDIYLKIKKVFHKPKYIIGSFLHVRFSKFIGRSCTKRSHRCSCYSTRTIIASYHGFWQCSNYPRWVSGTCSKKVENIEELSHNLSWNNNSFYKSTKYYKRSS